MSRHVFANCKFHGYLALAAGKFQGVTSISRFEIEW